MHLCYGTFGKVLLLCSFEKQKDLHEALLMPILGYDCYDHPLLDETRASKLFKCKMRIPAKDKKSLKDASTAKFAKISKALADTLSELIGGNMLVSAFAAIRALICEDSKIHNHTVVDYVRSTTKNDLMQGDVVNKVDFLTGAFVFTFIDTDNIKDKCAVDEITSEFIEQACDDYQKFVSAKTEAAAETATGSGRISDLSITKPGLDQIDMIRQVLRDELGVLPQMIQKTLNQNGREKYIKRREDLFERMSRFDSSAKELLPTVEYLLDDGLSEIEIVILQSTLARYYRDAGNSPKIYKYAMLALENMNKGYLDGYEKWKTARIMNHTSYCLGTISDKDMGVGFDLAECAKILQAYLNKAWAIIAPIYQEKDAPKEVKIVAAQIKGNLGAVSQKMFLATGKCNPDLLDEALSKHGEGLDIRKRACEIEPAPEDDGLIAVSHLCLATDYFYYGHYKLSKMNRIEAVDCFEHSLAHHEKALAYRENTGVSEIRRIESFVRCVGTRLEIWGLKASESEIHISMILELYRNILSIDGYGNKERRDCFRRAEKEHAGLIEKSEKIIKLFGDRKDGNPSVEALREICCKVLDPIEFNRLLANTN